MIIEGNVAFSNVTKHDVYNGQSTGKYTMTITTNDQFAQELTDAGVKVKDYEGKPQRKFSSGYDVRVLDAEGNTFGREVPRGSLVRLRYKLGNEHPVHGTATYLEAVRVLEEADVAMDPEDDNF